MSITGSLVGYENNNDLCNKKNRSLLNVSGSSKQCASLNSSISNSVIIAANSSIGASKSNHQNCNNEMKQQLKPKHKFHLNSLWSIWYGILATYLQGYLALHGAYRFLGCYLIQWRGEAPFTELNIQILLCGFVFLLLPLFLISTVFKVGNLANDGVKLATGTRKCSAEPQDGLEAEANGGTLRAIWTHGGPTSAFLHIIIALSLLVPRLLLESRLIENGNLPRENIWRTELDFMVTHRDRLVILSFMTSPYQNISNDSENDTKSYRTLFHEGNDEFAHTNLIEKFHSGSFDENDYFDTHEKLEVETPSLTTTLQSFTTSTTNGGLNNKMTSMPTSITNAVDVLNVENTRKQHERTRGGNRHNGNGTGSRAPGGGRKHSGQRQNHGREHIGEGDDASRATYKKDRQNRKEMKNSRKHNNDGRITDEIPDDVSGTSSHSGNSRKVLHDKDSHIHIVKPLEGVVPSTPISTDSKIIEIKPSTHRNNVGIKKVKRSSDDVSVVNDIFDAEPNLPIENAEYVLRNDFSRATAAPLIGAIPANITLSPVHLDGLAGCIQKYLNINKEIDLSNWSNPPSFEFLNLLFALVIWSSRYPSVFWATSKPFATIFSIQMIANALDVLIGFAGVSVIYKLQIVGMQLPLQSPTLLLNGTVTLSLYLLSILLIISSSMILYLYGHGRLSSRMRDRRMISTKAGDTWAYFAHCASLCFILALAVVKAPLMHDFSAIYRGSLDGAVLAAALISVMHIFFWIVLWLCLTAKRRWGFKLPPLDNSEMNIPSSQPLLMSPRLNRPSAASPHHGSHSGGGEETIYWPKLTPNSPKLKVTFNDVPSTLYDQSTDVAAEHDGKRNPTSRASLCLSSAPGEIDDGDYATLRATAELMHFGQGLSVNCDVADDTSEEGKLLECVRDDSVTYASTRDLEPPRPPTPPPPPPPLDEEIDYGESLDQLINAIQPVMVTVHTSEVHISSSLAPRIQRADSGVPHDAILTPRSESISTESSTSPPERAHSDSSSSGVHSGEEKEDVVIRSRIPKTIIKPIQPAIQEEPFGRSTNMRMSSFNIDGSSVKSSATLPISRAAPIETRYDYNNHCSTMPLPIGCHQQQQQLQFRSQNFITPTASKTQLHTTLPNGVRYSNPTYLRRVPLHVQNAESPYGILGLGAGHHTFSKHLHDPLMFNSIPEDRDSANYSMISEHDRETYLSMNTGNIH